MNTAECGGDCLAYMVEGIEEVKVRVGVRMVGWRVWVREGGGRVRVKTKKICECTNPYICRGVMVTLRQHEFKKAQVTARSSTYRHPLT